MTREELAATDYARERLLNNDYPVYNHEYELQLAFEEGVGFVKNNLWKPANDNDLPEYDRHVVVRLYSGKFSDAFRVNPDGYKDERGRVIYLDKYYNNWSVPHVKYWLDCPLPKLEED